MLDKLFGIFFILLGVDAVLHPKKTARSFNATQKKIDGKGFSDTGVKVLTFFVVVIGVFLIMIGVLLLFNKIRTGHD
ncbi:MAG: hypothetical protein HZA22_02515 [Nitrospirae bacterium]|nr:hypothetical protein [Nitrospirota bacterium]